MMFFMGSWTPLRIIHMAIYIILEVKSDHRSKFSNLSNWKEEA